MECVTFSSSKNDRTLFAGFLTIHTEIPAIYVKRPNYINHRTLLSSRVIARFVVMHVCVRVCWHSFLNVFAWTWNKHDHKVLLYTLVWRLIESVSSQHIPYTKRPNRGTILSLPIDKQMQCNAVHSSMPRRFSGVAPFFAFNPIYSVRVSYACTID